MSIIIIAFKGAPQVDQQAKEREAQLDSNIEAKVTGMSMPHIPYNVIIANL